jgi:hypothetical protein
VRSRAPRRVPGRLHWSVARLHPVGCSKGYPADNLATVRTALGIPPQAQRLIAPQIEYGQLVALLLVLKLEDPVNPSNIANPEDTA